MKNKEDYELILEEYLGVCDEYEEATARMAVVAAKPDCDLGDFKQVSERVTRLAQRLSSLRTAMKLAYSSEPPLICGDVAPIAE